MENEVKNILLHTINDGESLAQMLSTYALYKTLQKLGYAPVVYDEIFPLKSKLSEYIRLHCCISSNMHENSNKNEYIETFDALLTGSEKKWKYSSKESVDTCFLNFGRKNAKRIAYAASFGSACDLPLGPKNAAWFALKNFDGISVVDNHTLSIFNLEFGIDAEKVCNPILLLDQYPHSEVNGIEGLFITTFFKKRNSQKQKVAEMAEEIIKYRIIDYSKDSSNRKNKTADEYLDAVEKSSLIITDSAIITQLAIAYRKPFITVLPEKAKDSFESFECISVLENLGLMERVIFVEEDVLEKRYLCKKPIKYGLVDVKLNDLRSKAVKWLEDKLN